MKQIFMRFPGGKLRALTFSYDDGPEADGRLVALFQKYGLKGTFHLNSGRWAAEGTPSREGKPPHRTMTRSEAIALFKDSGMEVAAHGYNHAYLDKLPGHEVFHEIYEDCLALERDFGGIVMGLGCPYDGINELALQVIRDYGLRYFRKPGSTKKFDMPKDWLEFQATCRHRDPELMELAEMFVKDPVRFAPIMFCLCGHSWEFDTKDTWYIMEQFAQFMAGREDTWYATIGQICEYSRAFEQLVYSADMRSIYNPTCHTLYFQIGDRKLNEAVCSVRPGETVVIDNSGK